MSNREHLLTIVEPTRGGDAALALAHETVARGGAASVVIVVTDRAQRDIRAYAASAELGARDVEDATLDQLRTLCRNRFGGATRLSTHYGPLGSDAVRYVTPDTTAIALPDSLVTDGLVERLVAYSGRRVIVAPSRPAMSA